MVRIVGPQESQVFRLWGKQQQVELLAGLYEATSTLFGDGLADDGSGGQPLAVLRSASVAASLRSDILARSHPNGLPGCARAPLFLARLSAASRTGPRVGTGMCSPTPKRVRSPSVAADRHTHRS